MGWDEISLRGPHKLAQATSAPGIENLIAVHAYDASGRRTGDTGPLGTTAYQYDGSNRMTKITYPKKSMLGPRANHRFLG